MIYDAKFGFEPATTWLAVLYYANIKNIEQGHP